ncbi:hypothetical protein A2U01_0065593, partial [Trifolium medium]|nr:hypothetical protein [Trifolium medium]
MEGGCVPVGAQTLKSVKCVKQ